MNEHIKEYVSHFTGIVSEVTDMSKYYIRHPSHLIGITAVGLGTCQGMEMLLDKTHQFYSNNHTAIIDITDRMAGFFR
jgi:hypothetical protein